MDVSLGADDTLPEGQRMRLKAAVPHRLPLPPPASSGGDNAPGMAPKPDFPTILKRSIVMWQCACVLFLLWSSVMIGFMWKEKAAITTEVQHLQADLIAVKEALRSSKRRVAEPGSRNTSTQPPLSQPAAYACRCALLPVRSARILIAWAAAARCCSRATRPLVLVAEAQLTCIVLGSLCYHR